MRRLEPAVLGYTTLRLGIGMSMLIQRVGRVGNIPAFAQQLVSHFSKTWLPHAPVVGFAYITPFVEFLIGILVLCGLFTRQGLVGGGLWMVALIFGSTLAADYEIAGIQLLYSLIFFILLQNEVLNHLSFDRLVRRIKPSRPAA
jgi:thiosulfate dehydrogenase (quinone) large subunit